MPTTTKKPAAKKPATPKAKTPRAPKAAKPEVKHKELVPEAVAAKPAKVEKSDKEEMQPIAEMTLAEGRYSYAVGRRKTSVANVRLFSGKEKSTVNKKDFITYFGNQAMVDRAFLPLRLVGLENRVYVYVNVKGGGTHSQAQAVAHGIATAVTKHNPEFRKVLKKNGTLTRDSRMKERKKPGLKRARRGPQWAKR